MWYILEGRYGSDIDAKRAAARPAHLARLESLMEEGRLLAAGPIPAIDAEDPGPAGFLGSLIVAEFADQASAEAWLAQDPYQEQGVYSELSVRPFRKVLP
ncbi:YciI family protein [Luteimonas sp. FXH3W]|uniref:YciI family protein n=1 Tax=Aquilutibacter rugosus TaxID=3115820 RepID=A0ABU7V001_9GAMM